MNLVCINQKNQPEWSLSQGLAALGSWLVQPASTQAATS
jgi:hypothetical protein